MTNLSKPVAFLLPKDGEKIVGVTDESSIAIVSYLKNLTKLFANGIGADTGVYDLTLDGAAQLNKGVTTFGNIYYFSFPTDSTTSVWLSSTRVPSLKLTDIVLLPTGTYLGAAKGTTPGGIVYDKKWFNNDGIVNTISCVAPNGAPQKTFNAGSCHARRLERDADVRGGPFVDYRRPHPRGECQGVLCQSVEPHQFPVNR